MEDSDAHQVPANLPVLHREISFGNVLIRAESYYNPNSDKIVQRDLPETEADISFTTDFEFASVPDNPSALVRSPLSLPAEHSQAIHYKFGEVSREPVYKPRHTRTGTLQFAASAVLIGIRDKVPMERREIHDLESLCWVIIYLAYKRAIVDTVDTEAGELLKQENSNLFSSPSIPGILRNRAALLVAEQEGMLYHDKPVAEMEVPMDFGIRALVSHWTKTKSERPTAVLLQIIWEFLRSVQPRKTRLNTWDQEMKELFLRVAKAKRTQGLDQQPSHIQTPSRIVFTVGETVYTDDDFVLTHDGLSEKIQEIQEIAEEYKFDSS